MADWTFESVDDRRAIAAHPLRLVLTHSDDRWTHAIGLDTPSGPIDLARSLESDASRDDPRRVVSPAFQEFHWHLEGDPGVALLTGLSTPHHFSAAISFRADPTSLDIHLDVADRCRGPVDALASTYLVEATSGDLVSADPGKIAWSSPAWGPGRLEFVVAAPATAAFAEAGRRATRVQVVVPHNSSTSTQRWAYGWRWVRGDEAGPSH